MSYINFKYIKEDIDIFKEKGRWIVANIDQEISWLENIATIDYKNNILYLIPETEKLLPCIASKMENNEDDRRNIIIQFINELVWTRQSKINIVEWTIAGFILRVCKSSNIRSISSHFRISYLPFINSENEKLALSFYREAIGLNNTAYSFLSFYKIINMFYKNGKSQKKWIEDNLDNIYESDALKRLEELNKLNEKISDYLYVSCRCAIAHAGTGPTIKPDNIDDQIRLKKDLPIIKNLSEILIENELKVKTLKTFYKEHKHELFGFKNGKNYYSPDKIDIRLWNKNIYPPLESMSLNVENSKDSIYYIKCISNDELVKIKFQLDFNNDRIIIDPYNNIEITDDGTPNAAENIAEINRFFKDYYLNGLIEIWDTDIRKCLGFKMPFIPRNIDISETIKNFDNVIKKYKDAVVERSKKKPV